MVGYPAAMPEGVNQLPDVRQITLDHPWRWIAAGWDDFKSAPVASLGYGALITLISYLFTFLTFFNGMLFFVLPLIAGFFLIAPILAVGLYEISRTISIGGQPGFRQVYSALGRNGFNLAAMGLILLMSFLVWMLIANIVYALFYSGVTPNLENFLADLFLSGDHPLFLFAGLLSGGVVALVVYSISVVSTPLLIDRDIDVVTALSTSVRTVTKNPAPMMLWASLIVMFVGIGLVTFYIGLMFCMPLIGYASWHAYRDLVC